MRTNIIQRVYINLRKRNSSLLSFIVSTMACRRSFSPDLIRGCLWFYASPLRPSCNFGPSSTAHRNSDWCAAFCWLTTLSCNLKKFTKYAVEKNLICDSFLKISLHWIKRNLRQKMLSAPQLEELRDPGTSASLSTSSPWSPWNSSGRSRSTGLCTSSLMSLRLGQSCEIFSWHIIYKCKYIRKSKITLNYLSTFSVSLLIC